MLRTHLLNGVGSVAHLVGLGRHAAVAAPAVPVAAAAPAVVVPVVPAPAGAAAAAAAAAAEAARAAVVVPADTAEAAAAAAAAAEPVEDDEEDDDDPDKADDEKELTGSGKKARARRRERARCAAILNSEHAAKNPDVALQLALRTAMPRQVVLAMLEAMPRGVGGLDARMTTVPRPAIGAGAVAPGAPDGRAIAGSWDAAFAKAAPAPTGGARVANDTRASWDRAMRPAR